jgi:hypothetical protein
LRTQEEEKKEKGMVVAMLPHNDNQWISISGFLSVLVGY